MIWGYPHFRKPPCVCMHVYSIQYSSIFSKTKVERSTWSKTARRVVVFFPCRSHMADCLKHRTCRHLEVSMEKNMDFHWVCHINGGRKRENPPVSAMFASLRCRTDHGFTPRGVGPGSETASWKDAKFGQVEMHQKNGRI